MPDQVHIAIAMPPKRTVLSAIGSLRGKGAIAVALLQGKKHNFDGDHLLARGYEVSTVGLELAEVLRCARARRCWPLLNRAVVNSGSTLPRVSEAERPPLGRPNPSSHRLCRGDL